MSGISIAIVVVLAVVFALLLRSEPGSASPRIDPSTAPEEDVQTSACGSQDRGDQAVSTAPRCRLEAGQGGGGADRKCPAPAGRGLACPDALLRFVSPMSDVPPRGVGRISFRDRRRTVTG